MDDQVILKDTSDVEDFEFAILSNEVAEKEKQVHELEMLSKLREEDDLKFRTAISKRVGYDVPVDYNIDTIKLKWSVWYEIFDEAYGKPGNLIQPSHRFLSHSLLRKRPELQELIPSDPNSLFERLSKRSTSRAYEIVTEFTAENTRLAHMGDLVYWQAWLSAIGFTFKEPITEKELITFIVQHVEGLDPEIDHKLVDQGFKAKLGPHALATVKRRVGSLSVYLESTKEQNHCRNKEIGLLFQKLTKKYGSSKPSGKAITKDILNEILDTCGDKIIDTRDRALLLFTWGSGGRRRAEVADAQMKDLTKSANGDFVYKIPKSKTDQEGKGSPVPVQGRVANALNAWLTASGITEGAIFRSVGKGGKIGEAISPIDVHRIVRRRLKMAGYAEKQFSAHSLRSGFVTEAGRRGKPLGDVMAMTTHKSVTTAMRYYQAGSIINNSAANLADE